jgi:hypothetical protein
MYRFVGASGVVYAAREPLGSLTKSGSPVEGARQVAVGKNAIVVVDGKGDLQRSIDGGRAWSKVEIAGREGVIVDVAMLGDKGILVVAPQRFYGTKDDGVTWTVAKSPGVGVQSVVARDGALWVDGAEENMRFDPGVEHVLVRRVRACVDPQTVHEANHAHRKPHRRRRTINSPQRHRARGRSRRRRRLALEAAQGG